MLNKLLRRFEAEFIGQSREWQPVSDSIYHGRMSDAEIEAMRKRNEDAIQKRIEEMGEKWILHPSHKVQRLDHECK
jgi:hypothetical protein